MANSTHIQMHRMRTICLYNYYEEFHGLCCWVVLLVVAILPSKTTFSGDFAWEIVRISILHSIRVYGLHLLVPTK